MAQAAPSIEPSTAHWVTLVHASSPGRLRLNVQGLYRSPSLKAELETSLSQHAQIETVSANPLTGNILVKFSPDLEAAKILEEIEQRVLLLFADRPIPAGKPSPATPRQAPEPAAAKRSWFKFERTQAQVSTQTTAPPAQTWHILDAQKTLRRLETSPDGLSVEEAGHRLQIYGYNRLAESKRRSALQIFAEQIANPAMAMLGVSAVVSVATGGLIDAVVIVSAVLLNAIIGYVTENSSERTINALGSMKPTHAQVIRGGRTIKIPVEEIVIGDLLVLTPGSYVSADARLINSSRLTVDESALTGESLPVGKHWDFIAREDTPLADRKNMLHMGTIVTGGSGQAVVAATGHSTEIGVIQSLVGEVKPPDTLLQRQLDELNTNLATVCGALCVGVFGLGVLRGYTWLQMLSSAISLAVAAIPEGLPAVATTTLAIGIRNSHREKVLIRQLGAVESLGSVQVICLDKTGTLTLNKMKTVSIHTAGPSVSIADERFEAEGCLIAPLEQAELKQLLRIVCLCSEVKITGSGSRPALEGSPTESALIDAAINAGEDVPTLRAAHPLLK
ncbi:MAG: HAD-IC family P-type ATPase, partial [Methylococcaceae bacterium]|nr:HAD-IC family P-type ATPase [Methylococcaceae bacterium]